jgi:hypothetical protein
MRRRGTRERMRRWVCGAGLGHVVILRGRYANGTAGGRAGGRRGGQARGRQARRVGQPARLLIQPLGPNDI